VAQSRRLAIVVVFHHTHVPEPHFDLMIEPSAGAALWTWRCPTWPPVRADVLIRLADHRNLYLQFEGEIAGDRGRVDRVFSAETAVQLSDDLVAIDGIGNEPLRLQHEVGDRWIVD
jgi:hypothetical protein